MLPMKLLLSAIMMVASCATQAALNNAMNHAEWCEQNWPGRCQAYWTRVEIERDREAQASQRRTAIGAALLMNSQRQAAVSPQPIYTPPAPAPVRNCTSQTYGGTTYTNCY
jgi:hypothetical protein